MVFIVYREIASRVKFEPYLLIFLSLTGYRVHSIFSLRLFNDGPANIFAWISFYCFMTKKWTLGSVLYSLSISIKMNNLLFAPAIGVIFVRNLSISKTIQNLGICALVQSELFKIIKNIFQDKKFSHRWCGISAYLSLGIFKPGFWI